MIIWSARQIKEASKEAGKELVEDIVDDVLGSYRLREQIEKCVAREIEKQEDDLKNVYELRWGAQEKARNEVYDRIETLVSDCLEEKISRTVSQMKDQLLVELAKKAMGLDNKGEKNGK